MTALQSLRVLDLSRVLAGPLCTMLLGDLGAHVIKMEHPSGDDTRQWGPPFLGAHSTYYLAANRNKRSVALDLTDDADRALVCRLADEADVVVQNFRTGALVRFGLDETSVRGRNPRVVYCSLTGYGRNAGGRPGYDFLAQAEGGLMSVTGADVSSPTKVGVAVSDVLMGLHAAVGILAALRHRDRTGEGQHVEVNLLSSTLASLVNQAAGFLDGDTAPQPTGNVHPSIAPYQTLRTATAPLALAVGNDRQFIALCRGLGRDDLTDDVRFETNSGRVKHREALVRELESALVRRPVEEWQQQLLTLGVPCAQVNDLDAAFSLAEGLGLEPTVAMQLADGALTRQVAAPLSLSRTPVAYRLPPPLLDEHGDAVRASGWKDSLA